MAPAADRVANHGVVTSFIIQRHPIPDGDMASFRRLDVGEVRPAVLIFNYNSSGFNIYRHVCEVYVVLSQGELSSTGVQYLSCGER